ncbi:MAG: metal ABC transporter permease [Gemmataceae bacterium]|nr:metal ABC transporter permease [Gemmataceae bacterium]
MNWWGSLYNVGLVLVGVSLLAASAGAIGCFAVLRRRALTGDALAHGALPGLCLAFLAAGERSLPILLLGALASGTAGIGVIALLRRWTRIKDDAAIGIVLSVFFGFGVALLSIIQNWPGGSRAGLDSFILGKTAGMIRQDVYIIAGLAGLTLVILLLLYKEFKLVAFDASFARVQGWPGFWLDFLLMLLVALAVVVGLPAVGVLLMAALLIIPAAAARFWTERLGLMLVLSAAFGVLAGVAGTLVSTFLERIPTGPSIILAASLLFGVSLLLAPKRGWLARRRENARQRQAARLRRFLSVLYDATEPALPHCVPVPLVQLQTEQAWTTRQLTKLMEDAKRKQWIEREGDTLRLTPRGLKHAGQTARNERLWKLYLEEYTDQAVAQLQTDLPLLESVAEPAVIEALARKLKWE